MAGSTHPADRLEASIDRVGVPVCVGLDPVHERFPGSLCGRDPVDACEAFCSGVIDAVAPIAAAIKFQSACFERLGAPGVALMGNLRQRAADAGLLVILDAKRGDIGISSAQYAAAATADGPCHWITANPWLGLDGIGPFLESGLGVFALVRTSNRGGDAIQSRQLEDGRSVAELVADLLADEAGNWLGDCGRSALGAVVGATVVADAIALRERMPDQILLMPGVGAQGGRIEDVASCIGDGYGALITASRSVIYAGGDGDDWTSGVADAAAAMADALRGQLR